MEDKIIKTLKALRSIEPDQDFKHRSRSVILSTPRTSHHFPGLRIRFWEGMKFAGALSLASLLIFLIFGGLSYFSVQNLAPAILTGIDENNLLSEASAVEFQIRLNEIKYYEESVKQVTALLEKLAENEN